MPIISRTLFDKGLFIIPEDVKKSRLAIVQLSVLQEPFNRSQNLKIQPARAFYGWMTVVANDRVVKQHEIMFPYEEPLRFDNENAYLLTYLHCLGRNINDKLIQLLNGVPIEDYKPEWYQWTIDELRFKLFSSTVLKVDIVYEPIPQICGSINPIEQARPDPGSQNPGANNGDPGDVPSGSGTGGADPGGIPISPPYDPNTNDDGHSGPFIPGGTISVRITMYGNANNQNNESVPIDTLSFPSLWEIAPASNRPFVLRKGAQFRQDLFEWDVVGADGTVYPCGVFAWYGTPNFRVEPWSQ